MFNFLLDLIFPKFCIGCGKWGKYFCEKCTSTIEYFDNQTLNRSGSGQVCPYCERPSPYGFTHPHCRKVFGLDGMFTLAHYRGPIREAVRLIKYRSSFAICEELAKLIGEKYHYKYNFDHLVPVPLAKKRERERGFNQAEKLAHEMYKVFCIKYHVSPKKNGVMNLLTRTRETKPQFGLGYKERQKNVREVFALNRHSSLVTGHSYCLVDDVATTGSTIFECAKVLKRAGAKKVWAICIARGG